ncbi:centrosomal protein of 63 kDa-like [Argonauta hians]
MADNRYNNPQSLWTDLENHNMLAPDGVLMSSCEQELQDLVHHIDVVVKNRESDLKLRVKKVYKHFERKTKECEQHKATIAGHVRQISSLEAQVKQLTAEKNKAEENHETQVTKLKSKAAELRSEHERLHKTFLRKMHNMEKQRGKGGKGRNVPEKEGVTTPAVAAAAADDDDGEEEGEKKKKKKSPRDQQLSKKLKECEDQLQVVQKEKAGLQETLESVQTECKALREKLEDFELRNQKLCSNLEDSEGQRVQLEQEVCRFEGLVTQQNNDLVEYRKSDELLKRAVITLRTDLQTRLATIAGLQSELEQYKNQVNNIKDMHHSEMQVMQKENEQLREDAGKLRHWKDECTNMKEQLEVLKAEKAVWGKIICDQTTKLKEHQTKMEHKMSAVEQHLVGSHCRDIDDEMADLESQLMKNKVRSKGGGGGGQEEEGEGEEEEDYPLGSKEEVEDNDADDEEEEEAEEEEVGEEVEEEEEDLEVSGLLLGNKPAMDKPTTTTTTTATNTKENPFLLELQNSEDTLFCVSQSQVRDFLQQEEVYRRHWEDNLSKEFQHIWHNTETKLQQYIDSL